MFFYWLGIVLTWPKYNRWIGNLLVWWNLEPLRFRNEAVKQALLAVAFSSLVLVDRRHVVVGSRTRLTVEVLFQFKFGIESSLLSTELLLFLHFLARSCKR